MRITDKVPLLLAILAGVFWFAGGVWYGIDRPSVLHLLSPVLTLIGGVLAGILAERASRADQQREDDWVKFECANCGDVHNPTGQPCYCGCGKWRKGERILK